MKTVPLGRTKISIPRIALGATTFGREIDENVSRDILDYSLSHGLNLIDTAEAYGGGNARKYRRDVLKVEDVRETTGEMHSSENIIGRWMKDRKCRDKTIILTKFNTGGRPEQVKKSLRDSLARLQTDYVDIYMPHCAFKDVPIRETLEALTDEVKAGRIRSIGCSNYSAEQLKEAVETAEKHGLERMNSTEPQFNLAGAAARTALLPYCVQQQIASIIYSPLAAGFLAGKYSKGGPIPKGTRFDVIPGHIDVYFNDRAFNAVEKLRELSAETGVPMVKLAMAWVFNHPGVSSVLIGVRTRAHVDNALESFNFKLDPALMARMSSFAA